MFEADAAWKARANLEVSCSVPVGRGKRAVWELLGSFKEVRSGRFDLWFSTTHAVPLRSPVPTVAIIHDMIPLIYPEFQDWAQSAYLRLALIQVARKVDAVIANSEQTKSDIVRFAKVDPKKVRVVPFGSGSGLNPIDPNALPTSAWEEIPFRRFFFALGTLEPRKNLSRLFEALALLHEPEYRDVGLLVAGGRGWREQGIFQTLDKLKIGDRVKFFGYVPDVKLPFLFAAAQGFVFPSVYEGFGMPLVECMELGGIPITGNCGAMREVAGEAAISFNPLSVEEIACALKDCLDLNEEERGSLRSMGAKRAKAFNWEAGATKTRELFEELVR